MMIRDQRLINVRAELGIDPLSGGSAIGPNVEVVSCDFTLVNPRSVMFINSTVTDTIIRAKKRAVRLNWPSVFFKKCAFTGTYFDTYFGRSSNLVDIYKEPGGLQDCDFSQASLHLCCFFNCDPTTIKFPPWPHFTAIHTRMDTADWMATSLPPKFAILQKMLGDFGRRGYVATTIHWPTYAKQENDDTDPEAIRQLLAGKDYIVM